jgi:starch synthase (maltosyl-transferring)
MQKLEMSPPAGERVLRFVGDRLGFTVRLADGQSSENGWRAFLRTNLGRVKALRRAIIHAHTGKVGLATSPWRDIPMRWENDHWQVELALTEVGYFKAKPYLVDRGGWQHWPEGSDVGVSIHPDAYRTANTIYCAFTRMFGPNRLAVSTQDEAQEKLLLSLEQRGYAVLPPSGKFRDLVRQLPHIMGRLGCRILHLLPVHPTPTTYARFGRFGSPYACQDLLAVDPALVEFDRRATGIEQFKELTWAAHLNGGRLFLDVVINHTGWGSPLQEMHPEWFVRKEDGTFVSPGAWGTTWEDLAELQHQNPALWEYMADVFLEWCRRGVDGFRCDAGYKIPVSAWQYITARVQEEFPETIFLLEGLGGSWEATEQLLTEGGMQWAYSELFQNHAGSDVASYLDYALRQSQRVGLYVHYSETHDNQRLAKKGRAWSLLRNRLCALTSVGGGFGFTCGVEWLAREKIEVHQSRGLSWGNPNTVIPELSRLNRLLADHPCFFDNATLTRLSEPSSPVYALSRVSADGLDRILVLINTDPAQAHDLALDEKIFGELGAPAFDLLTGKQRPAPKTESDLVRFHLKSGACLCLAAAARPRGLSGERYRRARAEAAWALTALAQVWPCETIGACDWRELARLATADPARFLSSLHHLDPARLSADLLGAIRDGLAQDHFPNVITWELADVRRCCPVPPEHWLLVQDHVPFRVTLGGNPPCHIGSPQRTTSGLFSTRQPIRAGRAGAGTLPGPGLSRPGTPPVSDLHSQRDGLGTRPGLVHGPVAASSPVRLGAFDQRSRGNEPHAG